MRNPTVSKAFKFVVISAFFFFILSVTTLGETKTWTGKVSTDWNNASNWNTASVPSADDDVIIPACAYGHKMPIISAGTTYTKKLTVESGATLTQAGGTIIPGETITISGSFILDAGTFTTTKYIVVNEGGEFTVNGLITAKKLTVEKDGTFIFNDTEMKLTYDIENSGTIILKSGKVNVEGKINNYQTGVINIDGANVKVEDYTTNKGMINMKSGSFDLLSAEKKIVVYGGVFNHYGGVVSTKDMEIKNGGAYNQFGGKFIISHDLKVPEGTSFIGTGGSVHFIGLQSDGSEYYGNVQFYNVIIDSSASLKLNDNKDYIRIAGDFSNNNSNLDNEKGTIEFNSTSEQLIYSASSPASSKTLAAIIIIKSNSHITLLNDLGVKSDVELETGGTISLNGNDLYQDGSVYDGPTPVELVSFSASVKEKVVALSWKTVTELNNYGFEVERSIDSKDWNKIGFVNGFGNTTSAINYSFEDSKVSNNTYYYRLKQVDFDGSFTYSNTVAVNFEQIPSKFELYQNYPNPFNPSTKIKYAVSSESFVTIKVYNILGSEVATLVNENLPAGIHEVNFDGAELSSGAYIYKIQTKDFTSTKKMILNK